MSDGLPRRAEDGSSEVVKGPCLPGADIVDAVGVGMVQKPQHDGADIFNVHEVPLLAAVGIARIV